MLGTIEIVRVLIQLKEPQYLEKWKSSKAQRGTQLSTSPFVIIIGVMSIKKPSIK